MVEARGAGLKNGQISSCGCFQLSQLRKSICKPAAARAHKYLVSMYEKGAQERGSTWSLTDAEVTALANSDCHYCGASPQLRLCPARNVKAQLNGIDRKDNRQGYELENVVPCCSICNRAKSAMSYEEFVAYINRIKSSVRAA